jgi:outer membrane protein assembly factor BamB
MVIIGGYDGKVYAYPLIDGRLREQPRWIYPPQGNIGGSIIGGMVVADGKVYFGSVNGTVFALDVADGYKEWSYDIGQKIWSAPALAGNLLFIGCFDKKLYALDTVTGTKKWEFETGGAISSTPVVKDNLVYIGSYDRHIYAVDIEAGQQQWKFPYDEEDAHSPRNWFWAKPVISGNTLYAPCLDGKVYILNTDTGRYIDAINVSNAVGASPVLVGNSLVVAATNLAKNTSRVYAIDITNRGYRELTSFTEGVNAPLFTVNGVVYIHTTRDNFYGLNVQNGALQKFSLTTTTTTNK